jgi:formamidopyrimidine-DNA glycosylase
MPEGLEAEIYRRAAERTVGRVIGDVDVDPRQAMATEIVRMLPGCTITAARRHGKVVLLDLTARSGANDAVLGLHFGMTGRLVVDGHASIVRLEYGSGRDDPAWDRLVVRFAGGGVMRVNDPRRWATFVLDPDLSRLGPDLFTVSVDELWERTRRRSAAVKSVLLDQSVIAGLGNLCVDELLWQAGLSPVAPFDRLSRMDLERLVATMRERLPAMLALGGSHRGVIDPVVRATLPPCPRDREPLRIDQVAGRTTVWCPRHQIGGTASPAGERGRGRAVAH